MKDCCAKWNQKTTMEDLVKYCDKIKNESKMLALQQDFYAYLKFKVGQDSFDLEKSIENFNDFTKNGRVAYDKLCSQIIFIIDKKELKYEV